MDTIEQVGGQEQTEAAGHLKREYLGWWHCETEGRLEIGGATCTVWIKAAVAVFKGPDGEEHFECLFPRLHITGYGAWLGTEAQIPDGALGRLYDQAETLQREVGSRP